MKPTAATSATSAHVHGTTAATATTVATAATATATAAAVAAATAAALSQNNLPAESRQQQSCHKYRPGNPAFPCQPSEYSSRGERLDFHIY